MNRLLTKLASAVTVVVARSPTFTEAERAQGLHCLTGESGAHPELRQQVLDDLPDPSNFTHEFTYIVPFQLADLRYKLSKSDRALLDMREIGLPTTNNIENRFNRLFHELNPEGATYMVSMTYGINDHIGSATRLSRATIDLETCSLIRTLD